MTSETASIKCVRSEADIAEAVHLAWCFFDMLRGYPEVAADLDKYLLEHQVEEKFNRFADHFLPPKGDCILALAGDKAMGVVMMTRRSETRAEMNRMFITPEARGAGIGHMLCDGIMQCARDAGYTEMTLDTLRILEPAIALYRRAGFVEDTRPDAYGSDDPNVINMRRDL